MIAPTLHRSCPCLSSRQIISRIFLAGLAVLLVAYSLKHISQQSLHQLCNSQNAALEIDRLKESLGPEDLDDSLQQLILLSKGNGSKTATGEYYWKLKNKVAPSLQRFWVEMNEALIDQNDTLFQKKILEHIRYMRRKITVSLHAAIEAEAGGARRQKDRTELQDLVQKRLEYVQNPVNCSSAKKLVLSVLEQDCGFSCVIHHLAYSLQMAYATQRTLIAVHKGWRYAPDGWDSAFQPLSRTCNDLPTNQTPVPWRGEEASFDVEVIKVDGTGTSPLPKQVPLSIPEDLAERLRQVTPDPEAWFMGQFVTYLMRPQPWLETYLKRMKSTIGFQNPIVGLQIRRGDKITEGEATSHALEEYMAHVEQWFTNLEDIEGPIGVRRIYIASDDTNVKAEAEKKYPQYTFIGNTSVAGLPRKYTAASLTGIVLDIHLLSLCDFVVCTFSSNMCRQIYEMKQSLPSSASPTVVSLDWQFTSHPYLVKQETAVYRHYKTPGTDEIDLEPGDVITFHPTSNRAVDGYSSGRNDRTNAVGRYPSYKALHKPVIVSYPTYPEVVIDKS